MNLQQVFDYLADGELSQVFMGIGDGGRVPVENYGKLISSINLGLTDLHRRFLLKERVLEVELVDALTKYYLKSEYGESSTSSQPVKYIKDTSDPFTDDLIKIERILDDEGVEIALNVVDDPCSIRTPDMTTLVVPEELETQSLLVYYRANHPNLSTSQATTDPSLVEVNLPITHLQALLYFVASRVLNPVGMTNEFHEGNSYLAKYEAACAAIMNGGVLVDTQGDNTRLERNGWV